jgi:hypothetical protein
VSSTLYFGVENLGGNELAYTLSLLIAILVDDVAESNTEATSYKLILRAI